MQTRPFHCWLLALTLVVGQWLAVVHGVQHRLNASEPLVACEVCVAGHASAGPPPTLLVITLLPARNDASAPVPATPPSRLAYRLPPPRAPPPILV